MPRFTPDHFYWLVRAKVLSTSPAHVLLKTRIWIDRNPAIQSIGFGQYQIDVPASVLIVLHSVLVPFRVLRCYNTRLYRFINPHPT